MGSGGTKRKPERSESIVVKVAENNEIPKSQNEMKTISEFVDPNSVKSDSQVDEIVRNCWKIMDEKSCKSGEKARKSQYSRTVRVFVSSTFVDMHSERNILTQKVFPEVRAWCAERDLNLIEIDLRWGVTKDTTELETISICMKELDLCAGEQDGKPFFISLLGERYGWIPSENDLTPELMSEFCWIPNVSITHMEIFRGAYCNLNARAVFFVRKSNCLERVPPEHRERMVEKATLARKQLAELKRKMKETFPQNYFEYSADFNGLDGRRVTFEIPANQFASKATEFLKSKIAEAYGLDTNSVPKSNPLKNEVKVQ